MPYLIDGIEKEKALFEYPKVKEHLNLLKETVIDNNEHLQSSEEKDAKEGHKTANSPFLNGCFEFYFMVQFIQLLFLNEI
ncbi:MAG: hypothetical protein E7150_02445 [Bacillus sp. (in: Bacteria)]|nr:hypothetical protein [Bacillus sp. (in: firmicutes)]